MRVLLFALHASVCAHARFGQRQGAKRALPPPPVRVAVVVPMLRQQCRLAQPFHRAMVKHDLSDPTTVLKMFYVPQTRAEPFQRGALFDRGLQAAVHNHFAPQCVVLQDVDAAPSSSVDYSHCHEPTQLAPNATAVSASPAHWKRVAGAWNSDGELRSRFSAAGWPTLHSRWRKDTTFTRLQVKAEATRSKIAPKRAAHASRVRSAPPTCGEEGLLP